MPGLCKCLERPNRNPFMHSFQLDFVPPSTPETRPVIMNNYQQQQPQTSNSGESSTQPPPPPPQTYQLVPITMNGPPPLPPGAATLPPDYPKGSFNHPIPIHLPPGYHLVPQPAHLPPPQHGEDVRVYLAAAAAAGDQDKGDQQQQRVAYYASAAELYSHVQANVPPRSGSHEPEEGGIGANHYPAVTSSAAQGSAQPQEQSPSRLPPILQVEKVQVTTNATQAASASRRRNDANFACPVPGCGSTFTRRFNLRGHLRSHTEERPYVCSWPNCQKGFARQHDCKRHQALHTAKNQGNACRGCNKSFSRLDALNRHLRSDTGAECRIIHESGAAAAASKPRSSTLSQQEDHIMDDTDANSS